MYCIACASFLPTEAPGRVSTALSTSFFTWWNAWCHPALGVAVLVPGLAVDDEVDDLNAYAPAGGDTCI